MNHMIQMMMLLHKYLPADMQAYCVMDRKELILSFVPLW